MEDRLRLLLENSVKRTFREIGNNKVGLLFSAGVDSTLLAKICQDLGFKPVLISLITTTSKDLVFIERSSQFLNLPLEIHDVSRGNFPAVTKTVQKILKAHDIERTLMNISLGVCIYLACDFARTKGLFHLLSGQGPDELFAGYYKYSFVPQKQLQGVLEQEVRRLLKVDLKRDQAIADSFNTRLHTPYLEGEIIKFAQQLPAEFKIHSGTNKFILRRLARSYGLVDFIVDRPKKAMQYSTGIQKLVERCLRK